MDAAAFFDSRSSGRLTARALAVPQHATCNSASMEQKKLIQGIPNAVPMRIKVMPTAMSSVTAPQMGVMVRQRLSAISVE